jgi:hypothetical protein
VTIQQETPLAPAGLKFSETYLYRFWVRPDIVTFDNLYALSVRNDETGLTTQVFPVVGYIGDFLFDWSVPDHARTLVLRSVPGTNSLRQFKDLAENYGKDWLLCNAPNEPAAIDCGDAVFLRAWVYSQDRYRSLRGVYLASNGRGCVKIGRTDSCLLTRIRSLQIASPDELRVVAFIPTPNASEVEALLHERHKNSRIRGEWFSMSNELAIQISLELGGYPFK